MKFITVLAAIALTVQISSAESIWIEGEQSTKHSCCAHGWYDDVTKDVLSGGTWLGHYHKTESGEATYSVRAGAADKYLFWLRCNPFRTAMSYRLGDGAWTEIDLRQFREKIRISPKPDHRYIAWVKVGTVALAKGQQDLSLRITKGNMPLVHGGIDCMVFSNDGFTPTGAVRPGELKQTPATPDEWFPVIVPDETFSAKSVIDVSALLHRPAGKLGFLKRSGAGLKFEKSPKPVKFWGCGANFDANLNAEAQTCRIRYLAKHGVNMVRQHPLFGWLGRRDSEGFAERLDQFDKWFAELKDHGIYMTWSVFYPLMISEADGYDPDLFAELPAGREGLRRTDGLVNISPHLQDLQWAYLRELLTHVNPYTKRAYKDDPALAVVEVHNEDCVFWHHTLNSLQARETKQPKHAKLLRRMFCRWAKRRYRTDAALRRAWGGSESMASGELRLHGAWEFGGGQPDPRKGDFIRFLTELQRGFYERREQRLRKLGYKGVTVTTAWRAGGPIADPANLYCDDAMDMIDRHNYFGGGVGGHGIKAGPVQHASHLDRPGRGILSSGFYQIEDKPFSITEWTQKPPNQWKAEIAPLVAFYGMGLQGWDASYHFLNILPGIGGGWPNLRSYVTDTPHYIGQFPALAIAIHKGHITEAPLAAARRLRTDDLFRGIDPLGQDLVSGKQGEKDTLAKATTPREVLAIGRVTVSFKGGRSTKISWTRYVKNGVIRSMTGELTWDTKRRVVTITAKKTHGVIGFAGGETFKLPAAHITVTTPFVSLLLTALDDKPLAQSRHILITAMARDKQTDARYSPSGESLLEVGKPPLLMEPVQAVIRLMGAPPKEVNVLDFHGVPTGRQVKTDGQSFTLDGTHRTYYYEVKR